MSNFVPVTRIKVFGIGGGGCNAVNRMVEANIAGVDFFVANTDRQVLETSICDKDKRILLGENTTHGLGAGGKPEVGEAAAEESIDIIREKVQDADMIFIATGLGGGTGTGASPIFAKCAKEAGALTIAIVTKPFSYEGKTKIKQAEEGLEKLKKNVDSIIIIPNDKLAQMLGNIPIRQAFGEADNVLRQAVQTITDLVSYNAIINLDFADVRSTMADEGTALIGVGLVSADEVNDREEMAKEAARRAINCPLLEAGIKGAKKAIINISGGDSLTIYDNNRAIDYIKEQAGNDLNISYGLAYNEALHDSIIVTVIATGYDEEEENLFEAKIEPATSQIVINDSPEVPSFFNRRNDRN